MQFAEPLFGWIGATQRSQVAREEVDVDDVSSPAVKVNVDHITGHTMRQATPPSMEPVLPPGITRGDPDRGMIRPTADSVDDFGEPVLPLTVPHERDQRPYRPRRG
jgi:hypothetical protein